MSYPKKVHTKTATRVVREDLAKVKSSAMSSGVSLERLFEAVENAGLELYYTRKLSESHLFVKVPGEDDLHSERLASYPTALELMTTILELAGIAADRRIAELDAYKETPEEAALRAAIARRDRLAREADALVRQTIKELAPRAEAIRGHIRQRGLDRGTPQILYSRWVMLRLNTVPQEFERFHDQQTKYVFKLPEEKEALLELIENDEKIFPEKYQQFYANQQQTKQQLEQTAQADEADEADEN